MTDLSSPRILLGITGGIAAYKSAELVRLLVKGGGDVQVAMTASACRFVGPLTFQALSGKPVLLDEGATQSGNGMAHIDASRHADAVVVAPASANFLARLAHGMADDLLATLCLARNCPLLVAPAMNREMWSNPATQRNIARLREDGVTILGPASGAQACGETGEGRMLEAEELYQRVLASLAPKLLAGRRVLMTAGPTFEAIDAVRGLTNSSSGKMGYAIARAAMEAGADVTLVSGPVCLAPPPGVRLVPATSASDMLAAVNAHVGGQDVFISVAAVADYHVANRQEHKIKKDGHIPVLTLAPNPDILASVAARDNPPFCVGFAAESENLLDYAEAKRRRKKLPLLAANLVQHALGSDDNELHLLDDQGVTTLPRGPKLDQARRLIAHLAGLLPPLPPRSVD